MNRTTRRLLFVAGMSLLLAIARDSHAQTSPSLSLDQLRHQRRVLVQRPRRVIMNNDGCDVLYFPRNEAVTPANFLAKRTTPLAGTHVDTIAFCPTSSGFSNFTYRTHIGTVLTKSGAEFGILPDTRNITQDLIDQGADCLELVTDFCHAHEMEAFFSMRMNDTHDVAHRPDKPYFLFPPLKVEHPDWLVGEPIKRTPFGRWSSVDYARPEIRDMAFGFLSEVCHNYDIDGIELDFFRHLCYFKATATGGVASDDDRAVMTDLMRRVRSMTEQVGCQRGRPILIAIRVPDSVGYCRDMGLDIERWLDEKLVDLLITTGYFRLNPWQTSIDLGHQYGVAVYPCLSDSRVRGENRFRRSSLESYRGRAMNAWAAGADGIHLFNYFDPHSALWKEVGSPEVLRNLDKQYHVTVRDGDPRRFLAGGREYRTTQIVCPAHPVLAAPQQPARFQLVIGDDLAAAARRGQQPHVTLHFAVPSVRHSDDISVRWNDVPLPKGTLADGWLDCSVPTELVRLGNNQIEMSVADRAKQDDEWPIQYTGTDKPAGNWHHDPGSVRTSEELSDGALLIADRGDVSGDYLFYRHAWGAAPTGTATVEARVKVESGSNYIIVSNGTSGERLALWPDHIELYHNKKRRYVMNTTATAHCYRMELDRQNLRVFVDGNLRIDAPKALVPRGGYPRNEIAFGAANSPMRGAAYWQSIKARSDGTSCHDVVVRVVFGD